jgi:hypothetical protein
MRTIHDQWRDFESEAGQHIASNETELQKMRTSFYAGAVGVMEVMKDVATNCETNAAGAAIMQNMWEECESFVKALGS